MLTPKEYLDKFSRIYAFCSPYGIVGPYAIHRYRNLSHAADKVETSAAEGMEMKDKIVSALRGRYKLITGSTQSGDWIVVPESKAKDWYPGIGLNIYKPWIVSVFAGKGRPDTISKIITYGLATGVMTLPTMSDTCEIIGLDCNGFVGGYAKERGLTGEDGHLGPNSAPSIFASRGLPRDSWNEIQPHDVLLTPGSPQHIRIVQAKYSDVLEVCESASSLKGLSWRQYRYVRDSYGSTQVQGRSGSARMFELSRSTLAGGTSKHWVLACRVGL
jgi:hypothetical protein